MSAPAERRVERRDRPAEVVGGLLATLSIFGSCIALVERPVRVTVFTMLIALIAAAIGGRHQRLAAYAVGISAGCFVLGTFFAVLTAKPLL